MTSGTWSSTPPNVPPNGVGDDFAKRQKPGNMAGCQASPASSLATAAAIGGTSALGPAGLASRNAGAGVRVAGAAPGRASFGGSVDGRWKRADSPTKDRERKIDQGRVHDKDLWEYSVLFHV